jgi:hypothetical protein
LKPANTKTASSTVRFSAKLIRSPEDGWSHFTLPAEASAQLPSFGRTMVEGTIHGFPFRAPLEPNDERGHRLRISDAVRDAAGAGVGDTITVEVTRIGDEPEISVPADLSEALAAAPVAQALFEEITPMARREWVRWVASAKQDDTRARRIENGIDMLNHGKRRPCCFPGVNWVTKDLVSPDETWLSLPGSKNRS